MYAEFKEGKIFYYADSDALIVKGLVALLLKCYSGFPPSEILETEPEFIKEIGIENHLSPTRTITLPHGSSRGPTGRTCQRQHECRP